MAVLEVFMSVMPVGILFRLPMSWRLLITGFLLVLGAGYLAGALNASLSVGITPASIADHYGDNSLTQDEASAISKQGFVEEEFSFDDESGGEQNSDRMGGMMHTMGGMGDGDGASGPTSITAQQMAQLAHVHLLGFAMILFSVGALTCVTTFSEGTKTVLVALLFLSLGGDIGGLYLVRFASSGFAALNMAAGVMIGVCLAATSVRVLWELWGVQAAQVEAA